ncbi:MAG TPA: hypothetical protein VFW90_02695, partial [Candidatus Saccharimonadales bacterium]|nr:hypothetical protein [Candidatus Saccharimonadales bacterium]
MRKGALIILAVAIIGALGAYANGHHGDDTVPLAAPSNNPTNASNTGTPAVKSASTTYKDGTYAGNSEETPYGVVQVAAVISGG